MPATKGKSRCLVHFWYNALVHNKVLDSPVYRNQAFEDDCSMRNFHWDRHSPKVEPLGEIHIRCDQRFFKMYG